MVLFLSLDESNLVDAQLYWAPKLWFYYGNTTSFCSTVVLMKHVPWTRSECNFSSKIRL